MSSTITITQQYGYVALAAISTFALTFIQGGLVNSHRKKAKIPYPQFYAENAQVAENIEARKFNCAQRAHGNTLESQPTIVTLTLFAGLRYPTVAAVACGMWTFTRLIYTLNYISGDPKRRNGRLAGTHYLAFFTLFGAGVWSAIELVQGKW